MATGPAGLRNAAALQWAGAAADAPPAVLVLGGSTFMGRELVQRLVKRPARVCVVNRGRSYWGTDDPSGGRAARLLAVRRDARAFADSLHEVTERLGGRWALVADFSAYNGPDIRAALDGLRGRFDKYAYISSDSVYEVSALAGEEWASRRGRGDPAVAEGDSVRPADRALRKRLRKADSYGDGKLEAEEALAEGLGEYRDSCRGVCCRLPDVIGPFDDTLRLWAYWHWLHAGPADPPQVQDARGAKRPRTAPAEGGGEAGSPRGAEDDGVPLAFVFSRDVARFIDGLLDAPAPADAPLCDAVNLACEKQVCLRRFLTLLAAGAGLEAPAFAEVARPKTFLPSVDRPWPLCCARMLKAYGFAPTPLDEVLRHCAAWFAQACTEFPRDALRAAMKLPPTARKVAIQRAGITATPSSSSSSSSADS